jgi:signal transduction histidine kinase
LSLWRFLVLFLAIAVTAANAIGSVVWYALFRSYGAEVLVPVTITANLVAIPILAFLAHVIQELKQSNDQLSETKATLHVHVTNLEQVRDEERRRSAELIRALSELSVARDQAEAANHTKSEFLATMSHELRTPLNAIIGFSDLMTAETLGPIGPPRYREYVEDINASGMHLLGLINDLLDLSKIEAGKFELNEGIVDVSANIQEIVRQLIKRAEQAQVTLIYNSGNGVPTITADSRAIDQILLNLLTNAIKFTSPGGRVTIDVEADYDQGMVIRVTDTGIGIAENDLAKVVLPFEQASGAYVRENEGTGLGLPIVKSLVELHGGTFVLESRIGEGTTASVRLPAERIIHASAALTGSEKNS